MPNSSVLTDRLFANRHLRLPLAVSGAAVLGLSMLLSVGPVLGAANHSNGNGSNSSSSSGGAHGTSGNVKVHDAGTGVETSGTDNEPHVCAFWLGFEFDAPYEAGTWVVVSWAPTGDGSTVASGVYNTAGDGVDNSGVVEVPAGHYRVEWAATGATSSKKKTFWVDADCGQTAPAADEVSPPEDVTPPTDAPGSPDEVSPPEDVTPPTDAPGSPAEESQPEELPPPTDAPGSPAEESQPEELPPPTDAPGSPAEESQPEDVTPPTDAPGSSDDESPPDELVLSGQETAPQEDEPPAEEAPATEEEAPATEAEDDSPAQEPAETDESAPAGDSEATDPGTPPAQDELDSIGGPDGPTMADTATPQTPLPGGLPATLGLLLLIGAHAAIRRDRLIPATQD